MTMNPDFDRIAAAWLADGPTRLSDRVLDASLAQVHLTRQRRAWRGPWRFPTMFINRVSVAALGLIVVVAGAGFAVSRLTPVGSGGPSGSPVGSSEPSPSPIGSAEASPSTGDLGATFVSARYGYSVRYPSTWSVRPALVKPGAIDHVYLDPTGPSPYDVLDCGPYPPGCGDPHVRYGTFFGVAASPPPGQSPQEWVAANHEPQCASSLGADTVTIDGREAFITEGGCDAGLTGSHFTVLLATEKLVYRFQLTSPLSSDERFLGMLSTIRLSASPPTP